MEGQREIEIDIWRGRLERPTDDNLGSVVGTRSREQRRGNEQHESEELFDHLHRQTISHDGEEQKTVSRTGHDGMSMAEPWCMMGECWLKNVKNIKKPSVSRDALCLGSRSGIVSRYYVVSEDASKMLQICFGTD